MRTSKTLSRQRRSKKTRARIRLTAKHRLVVHRTPKHIYAQLVECGDNINTENSDKIITSLSTLNKVSGVKYTGNKVAAENIGKQIAKLILKKGIDTVAFDRSGFAYHGRIKALADAAREQGLKF